MFFLPTRGRPERIRGMLSACLVHGMKESLTVILNGADQWEEYFGVRQTYAQYFDFICLPENEGFNGALNWVLENYPGESYYGCLADDCLPRTQGWDRMLVGALNHQTKIVSAIEEWQPTRLSPITVWNGNLLRLLGYWMLPGLWSRYADDLWEHLGLDLSIWQTLPNVRCEHVHFMNKKAPHDATYALSYGSDEKREADRVRYEAWCRDEKEGVYEKVRHWLNPQVSSPAIVTQFVEKPQLHPALAKCSLYIATPCTDGRYERTYTKSLYKTLAMLREIGIKHDWAEMPYNADIAMARGLILGSFKRSIYTHLLMVDADMGWQAEDVFKLIMAEKDFIAAAGPKKVYPITFAVNLGGGNVSNVLYEPATNTIQVPEVGGAFVLVSRVCIDRMIAAYPTLAFDGERGLTGYGLFDPVYLGRRRLSEDFAFCHRWVSLGGVISVAPMVRLSHTGSHTFSGALSDQFEPAEDEAPGEVMEMRA